MPVAQVNRTNLDRGLAAIAALHATAASVTTDAGIDWLTRRCRARVGDLPWSTLLDVATAGHLLSVAVDEQDWRFEVRAEGVTRPYLSQDGTAELVLRGDQIEALTHAIDLNDAAAALAVLADMTCAVELRVRNDVAVTGAHWVTDTATLATALTGPAWLATVTALAGGPRVIITDESTPAATMGAFSVAGLGSVPLASPAPVATSDGDYLAWRSASRPTLPSPTLFAPHPKDAATALRAAFAGVTRLLVWWWLADEATIEGSTARLLLRGAKYVPLTLQPEPTDAVATDVALYVWATSLPDPALAEAVQHAASLAIDSPADLATAAEPALRTARSLYELARRNAVAEALATRRTARSAAVSAARDAGKAAREAATKTVERVLVQVGATAGIFLTRAGKLVNRGEAIALLAAVAAVTIASFVVTWCVDLASAGRTLDAELADLDQYRDSLAREDIEAIRAVSVIGAARRGATHARIVAAVLYGAVLTAIVIGIIVIAAQRPDHDDGSTPTPSPTISPSAPGPVRTSVAPPPIRPRSPSLSP